MSDFPFVQLRGITRSYQMGMTEFSALQGVDLDIDEGEFVAVVGPSGSGKSSLMYILGCLDTPTSGTYRLAGREVSGLSDDVLSRVRNEEIGFVFQQYNLLSELKVMDNISLGMVYGGFPNRPRNQVARSFAEHFGLGRHLGHKANELSGGQMQRVAIARALAGQPRLILADEPTGNLDSSTSEEIMQVFRQLNRDGHTILLVTHDAYVAKQAKRIVKISDGRIVEDESNIDFRTPGQTIYDVDVRDVAREVEAIKEGEEKRSVSLLDTVRMALREGMLGKKGRTFLTMLGIIFGVAAVIAMNSITQGGKQRQLEQLQQIGLNNIQVRDKGMAGVSLLSARELNPYGVSHTDIEALREYLPEIEAMAAWRSLKAELRYDDRVVRDGRVLGVRGDYEDVVNFYVRHGRFLVPEDEERFHRVCVLGSSMVKELGLGDEPLGKWIIVGDEPFKVVGIMESREFGASEVKDVRIEDRNRDVYLPYASLQTYFKKLPFASQFDTVSLRMEDEERLIETSKYVHHIISDLHNEAEDFEVLVPLEKLRQAQETKEVFNVMIVVIAAISLVVGGIGIMNIMLANVTERTREIGIRRAVGASRKNVLYQFLAESLLISAAGGVLGLIAGVAVGKFLELAFAFPVAFGGVIMAVAVLVSVFIGIGFGIYPAWLAARMDPVDALRA